MSNIFVLAFLRLEDADYDKDGSDDANDAERVYDNG